MHCACPATAHLSGGVLAVLARRRCHLEGEQRHEDLRRPSTGPGSRVCIYKLAAVCVLLTVRLTDKLLSASAWSHCCSRCPAAGTCTMARPLQYSVKRTRLMMVSSSISTTATSSAPTRPNTRSAWSSNPSAFCNPHLSYHAQGSMQRLWHSQCSWQGCQNSTASSMSAHRDGLVHGQRHAIADCAQHRAQCCPNVEEAAEPAECETDFGTSQRCCACCSR